MGPDNLIEEPDKPYNIRHRCFFFAKEVIMFVKECSLLFIIRPVNKKCNFDWCKCGGRESG
jgi:hypothetical protein